MGDSRLVLAKLNRSLYYQGEASETRLRKGDENFERFNFRRCEDNQFRGMIPRQTPVKSSNGQEWLVVFIARAKKGHFAVGWYEDATFEESPRPHPADKRGKVTYTIRTSRAHLIPPVRGRHFRVKPELMTYFASTTYIYARGPCAEDQAEWRECFAEFAERVKEGNLT